MTQDSLTENEQRVLYVLDGGWDEYAYGFDYISSEAGLSRNSVRDACRSLAAKGLAKFMRGLFNYDDGNTAGSGYAVTEAGHKAARIMPMTGGAEL